MAQPIKFSGYLFALISNDGQVMLELFRFMQVSKGVEVDRHAGFHVHGAAAEHDLGAIFGGVHVMRYVICQWNGIDVACKNHAGIHPAVRARAHGIAKAGDLHVETTQGFFHRIRDGLLVVGGARDIDERLGHFNGVGI